MTREQIQILKRYSGNYPGDMPVTIRAALAALKTLSIAAQKKGGIGFEMGHEVCRWCSMTEDEGHRRDCPIPLADEIMKEFP